MHKEAIKYDIGVYFEANGHGSIVFKNDLIEKLINLKDTCIDA